LLLFHIPLAYQAVANKISEYQPSQGSGAEPFTPQEAAIGRGPFLGPPEQGQNRHRIISPDKQPFFLPSFFQKHRSFIVFWRQTI
jgi:hypothetical protein